MRQLEIMNCEQRLQSHSTETDKVLPTARIKPQFIQSSIVQNTISHTLSGLLYKFEYDSVAVFRNGTQAAEFTINRSADSLSNILNVDLRKVTKLFTMSDWKNAEQEILHFMKSHLVFFDGRLQTQYWQAPWKWTMKHREDGTSIQWEAR